MALCITVPVDQQGERSQGSPLAKSLPVGCASPIAWQRDDAGTKGLVGVPQGCLIRNTFLEFDDGMGPKEGRTRSKSCEPTPTASRTKEDSCFGFSMLSEVNEEPTVSTPETTDGSISHEGQTSDDAASTSSQWAPRSIPDEQDVSTPEFCWSPPQPPTTGRKGQGKHAAQKSNHESIVGAHAANNANNASAILLRGLPFNVSEDGVMEFIEEAGVTWALSPVQPVNLIINAQGRPSGFAEIHLKKPSDAWEVRQNLHMRSLGGRYIEALPSRPGKGAGVSQTSSRRGPRSWRNRG